MKLLDKQIILWTLTGVLIAGIALNLSKRHIEWASFIPREVISPVLAEENSSADYLRVEKMLNASGSMKEGAFVVQFPRSDLKMKINDEPMPIALGFTSWVAFKKMDGKDMIMGDLVLLEKEINPVISALADADVNVTALHRHFLGEEPRLMYMHIHSMGEPAKLARGIRNALDRTATPNPKPSSGGEAPKAAVNTKRLEEVIGNKGDVKGGVFKITVGRPGVTYNGVELTSSMGINSWAAFVGTNEKAHVAGDIIMTPEEVNRVIRTLREGGIDIVSVHNHMLNEEPRTFFLHYWGTGPAEKLAQTVRRAFDEAEGLVR